MDMVIHSQVTTLSTPGWERLRMRFDLLQAKRNRLAPKREDRNPNYGIGMFLSNCLGRNELGPEERSRTLRRRILQELFLQRSYDPTVKFSS